MTATLIVPTMINMIVNHPDVEATDTSLAEAHALRRLADAGGGDPPRFRALPHTGFVQAYGQSEAAPCMTFLLSRVAHAGGAEGGQAEVGGPGGAGLRDRHSRRATTRRRRSARSARSAGAATM